jgi:methionyl-tRNA formyltransferase
MVMRNSGKTYIIACSTQWALTAFLRRRPKLSGQWISVVAPADLDERLVESCKPRYIFFPHWSWIVPDPIIDAHECVCFHMTDLPYGRGGSPLQNLIERGAKSTKLTALRMTSEIDAGPIYAKRDISLNGAAHECYARAAELSLDLIEWIIATEPTSVPQVGEPTMFRRRQAADSRMPNGGTLDRLYDHIRMLDAAGYPNAFLECGVWRFEFRDAEQVGQDLNARVRITKKPS